MLKEVDKNMMEIKQEQQNFGIIAGMDAQVEAKRHQEPVVGGRHKECLEAARKNLESWRVSLRGCSCSGSPSTNFIWRIPSVKIGNLLE